MERDDGVCEIIFSNVYPLLVILTFSGLRVHNNCCIGECLFYCFSPRDCNIGQTVGQPTTLFQTDPSTTTG